MLTITIITTILAATAIASTMEIKESAKKQKQKQKQKRINILIFAICDYNYLDVNKMFQEITLYRGLKRVDSVYFLKKIEQLWTKDPMDMIRDVVRN